MDEGGLPALQPEQIRPNDGGMTSVNDMLVRQGNTMRLNRALANVLSKYPVLGKHNFAASYGPNSENVGGGGIEFYSAKGEDANPTPGRPHLRVFDRNLQGNELESALKGDMLHHLPGVDPQWDGMRNEYAKSITPQQSGMDQRAYQSDVERNGEKRPFDQWMNQSRLDAHIRGKLTPDRNDEWAGIYTPQQEEILKRMDLYISGTNGDVKPSTDPNILSRILNVK